MTRNAIIVTLGCRLNTADSALLTSRLETAGYAVVEQGGDIALAILNSCTVTAEASRKSRQAARKLRAAHPEATIVVTGCAAELEREAFLADGSADVVLTNPEKRSLVELVMEYLENHDAPGGLRLSSGESAATFAEDAVASFPFRSRAFLKIQEGCNNFCSYCIVPYVRGRERSRAFAEVLKDCRQAVEAGFPELVLTGVNTCAYSDSGYDLAELVREITKIEGDFRIRLSSTEPAPDNRAILELIAGEPKVCRFLHLALQNGSDRILKQMNRRYGTAEYAAFVRTARKMVPGIHLGSDLIVGFPGETDDDFEECRRFVETMEFSNLHIFTYSPREGTPAASMPNRVPAEVAKERYRVLSEIAEASKRKFAESQQGMELPVIFERQDEEGNCRGWSDNYLEVREKNVPLNRIVRIIYPGSPGPGGSSVGERESASPLP